MSICLVIFKQIYYTDCIIMMFKVDNQVYFSPF